MKQIEIRYNSDYDIYELWEHILNDPKDILYPIKYSNFIDSCTSRTILEDKALEEFNIRFHEIKFTTT